MGNILKQVAEPRWQGICQAAKTFGCSKVHLSLVLKGQRKPGKALAEHLAREGVQLPRVKNIVH